MNEHEIDTAVAALRAAEAAHAALLAWDGSLMRFVPQCSDLELRRAFVACLQAQRTYLLACGDTESAQLVSYDIEDETKAMARAVRS